MPVAELPASRTAVLVCQGRAVADGRIAVGRFADPVAAKLLTTPELVPVEQARAGGPPGGARERLAMEAVRACAEVVVPRTVLIDDAIRNAIRDRGLRQVVIVGAGLDSRPWRLAELRDSLVISVDHPASQADARRRSAGLTPTATRLEFVPVDLTSAPLDVALRPSAYDPSQPTVWVWEGVVPYLRRRDVRAGVAAIASASAPGSVLVVNYQSPSWLAALGRRLMRLAARVARLDDPLAGEPWRSTWTPDAMRGLLTEGGFVVRSDDGVLDVATRLGSPVTNSHSIAVGRVVIADRAPLRG